MTPRSSETAEDRRLGEDADRAENWKRWGPYLSERQWGTVREDYSRGGEPWTYFTHDHARSRAYRWGEDGLLGICDRQCRLCFALALWNGNDPILKERLFGLTGPEGNHGEDVKECYYYLDSTPTHSFMRALYKYPQATYPYADLVAENGRRGFNDPEFELADTGVFDGGRYFDVFAEYAKAGPEDILIRVRVANRGPEAAPISVLPTVWYRNTWVWDCRHEGCELPSRFRLESPGQVRGHHPTLGESRLLADPATFGCEPTWLFTDNETNHQRLDGGVNRSRYVKDGFHRLVVNGEAATVNPGNHGSKAALYWHGTIQPGAEVVLQLRLVTGAVIGGGPFGETFDDTFAEREAEANEFYGSRFPPALTDEERLVARQAHAGLLWTKQFYHYIVKDWLEGDPATPPPPAGRAGVRNYDWPHLFNRDVISMPDKWEYPWYAAWDLAFHMVPLAETDADFAKSQLLLFLREWYMHPNGQIPAYEFSFSDVNPPVHAWACWRVYKICGKRGGRDREFLKRAFHKLMLNFTWWVNRKDANGNHLFAGGFLGLDNIGVFDRSKPLPTGGYLEQADGTAWMAFFCGTMLSMALELARHDAAYEDIASKFFEHFVAIVDAINTLDGAGLWDDGDGFYYDRLHAGVGSVPLKTRSMVGLIPLLAVEVLDDELVGRLKGFRKRMEWFLEHRRDLARHITYLESRSGGGRLRLLAVPTREKLTRVLRYVLDESEFLSPYGVRSLSKYHGANPFIFRAGHEEFRVDYVPAESNSGMFGGNSNWRGPIWFPINYLLVEALERYHHYYGDELTVEFPTGSGRKLNLRQVAQELASRLASIFLPDAGNRRPCHGDDARYADDPHWRQLPLFYEYFHGDTGRGVGASHQTGWTALVARLMGR